MGGQCGRHLKRGAMEFRKGAWRLSEPLAEHQPEIRRIGKTAVVCNLGDEHLGARSGTQQANRRLEDAPRWANANENIDSTCSPMSSRSNRLPALCRDRRSVDPLLHAAGNEAMDVGGAAALISSAQKAKRSRAGNCSVSIWTMEGGSLSARGQFKNSLI